MRTALVTAVYGGYDSLERVPPIEGVDCIAFTDDPTLEADGWDVRCTPSAGDTHRAQAKWFKLFPHKALPEYQASVWIDASHEVLSQGFVLEALAAANVTGMAVYKHPWRDCIYEEATHSVVEQPRKYAHLPLEEQVASYRAEGHPEHWGLYACGTIARFHTPTVAQMMDDWSAEIDRWTYQDQLSLPVVCRRLGVRPGIFPMDQVFGNTWTRILPHNRED